MAQQEESGLSKQAVPFESKRDGLLLERLQYKITISSLMILCGGRGWGGVDLAEDKPRFSSQGQTTVLTQRESPEHPAHGSQPRGMARALAWPTR